MAKRALVEVTRPPATDIEQDETNGPTDRGVGPISRPKDIAPGIHADLVTYRAVDDEERGRHVGGGLNAIQVEVRSAHGEHGRTHDRSVDRLASGHDDVDGEHLPCEVSPSWRHTRLLVIGLTAQGLDDGGNFFLRGRHHGQAIRPPLFEIPLNQINRRGSAVLLDGAVAGRHFRHPLALLYTSPSHAKRSPIQDSHRPSFRIRRLVRHQPVLSSRRLASCQHSRVPSVYRRAGVMPLNTNFCTRRPRWASAVYRLPLLSLAM